MQLTQMNIQSWKQLVSRKNKECLYLQQFHKLQKFLVPSSWFCAFIQMQIISKSTDSPMENLLSPSVTFWSLFTSYPACGYYSNEAFPQKNKSRLIMSSDIVEEYFNVQRIGLSCILYTPPRECAGAPGCCLCHAPKEDVSHIIVDCIVNTSYVNYSVLLLSFYLRKTYLTRRKLYFCQVIEI